MSTTPQPRIDRVMVLSTAQDAKRLDNYAEADDAPILVDEYSEFGWHVYVVTDPGILDDLPTDSGLSEHFIACLALAAQHDCTFIRFDRDESPVDGLAVHDW